jgi:DNA-binding IclR family transcriptional regulator
MKLPTAGQDKGRVPALMRGFAILDLIAREPGLAYSAIQSRLGLPKSTCHHLISTLCRLGALKLQSDRGYVLGLRLFEIGALAAGQRRLEHEALPHMRRLASDVQLTCHLGVREGDAAVYLAKVECNQEIKVNSWVGKRLSLYSTALGKALLAWLPAWELDEVVGRLEFEPKCQNTLAAPAVFKAHLAEVRDRGWATDDEEDVLNIRCVAAPVMDMQGKVVAAVSLVGTVFDIDADRFEPLARRLCTVADDIAREMGLRT